MTKSGLYAALRKLLQALGLCNKTDTLPSWIRLHPNGEIVVDGSALICKYFRDLWRFLTWEHARALAALTFIDNAQREAELLAMPRQCTFFH